MNVNFLSSYRHALPFYFPRSLWCFPFIISAYSSSLDPVVFFSCSESDQWFLPFACFFALLPCWFDIAALRPCLCALFQQAVLSLKSPCMCYIVLFCSFSFLPLVAHCFCFVICFCFALCFVCLPLLHVDLLLCCCFLFFIHKDRMVGHVWLPLFNTILEVELARHVSFFALH